MKSSEIFTFYAYSKNTKSQIYSLFEEYNNTLQTLGVVVTSISPNHPSLHKYRKIDAEIGWKSKTFPLSLFSPRTSIEITNAFVRIIIHSHNHAVIIEDKEFAETMKAIFNLSYKNKKL